ncbi:hypothetical protein J576_0717 [Acinetobacter sp. 766875]|nr:hypothetical protein ACIN5021_0537 [Acinetobacter sp. OIFC021]EXE52090.1 hypothetical protein J576_0717 [Acinetobacter sp. 766875]
MQYALRAGCDVLTCVVFLSKIDFSPLDLSTIDHQIFYN